MMYLGSISMYHSGGVRYNTVALPREYIVLPRVSKMTGYGLMRTSVSF